MDLVASYDSDNSDFEGNNESRLQPLKKPASGTSKSFDIIELESDTDDETTTQSDNTKASSDHNRAPQSSKPPDCIDLSEEDIDPTKDINKPNQNVQITSDSANKKTDFLNLEGSDTDDEIPRAPDNITNLINSASLLNEAPCGPVKPPELFNLTKSTVSNTFNTEGNTPSSSYGSNINLENTDNDQRLKADAEIVKPVSFLFKENERVIEASQKNIVCRMPRQVVQTHRAHSNIIMSLNWCIPNYSHLYLTASLDGYLKIWDLYHRSPVQSPVQCINVGTGLSAAKWSLDGGQIVTGGTGRKAFVFDVQTGKRIIEYDIYNYVNSMDVHPYMEDVFLCGTRNAIMGFDIRVNTTFPIRSFFSNCKEVLDIVFLDENEFVCSTNIASQDSADRTIMVWDFSSGAILSNQIYLERYTCPSLKVHPSDSSFVAQTNGDYIASFSTSRPYKIKNKRYAGHTVSGHSIECDISPDGKYLVSGDAEGGVFFYNYTNTAVVHKTVIKKNSPTNRLKWHPAFPSMMISATHDGQVQIWK